MDEIINSVKGEMGRAVEVVRQDLSTIRTGRATPQLLENLPVEAYQTKMKLVELASISVPDTQTLIVTPFDLSNGQTIAKTISDSGMGFTVNLLDNIIRVIIPPLSSERREEFVKLVGVKLEGGRVMIRQLRHKYMEQIREADNDEDTKKRLEREIQDLTDKMIAQIEALGEQKELELRSL